MKVQPQARGSYTYPYVASNRNRRSREGLDRGTTCIFGEDDTFGRAATLH